MMTDQALDIIEWAANHAKELLEPLGNRWFHTQGVVRTAEHIGQVFNIKERELLIAGAYVHDIGYAPQIQKTGFHPLDGANYLISLNQPHLASLVAYHSEATFEATLRGLLPELNHIHQERSILSDALTYCDMHTGPSGQIFTFEQRIANILQRYPENHIVNKAIRQALPSYVLACANIQNLLQSKNML